MSHDSTFTLRASDEWRKTAVSVQNAMNKMHQFPKVDMSPEAYMWNSTSDGDMSDFWSLHVLVRLKTWRKDIGQCKRMLYSSRKTHAMTYISYLMFDLHISFDCNAVRHKLRGMSHKQWNAVVKNAIVQ